MLTIIPNKLYSLMQCRCSCQFYVHSSLYCAVKPCGRKLKEYKNTQPLIGPPEPLPETGVLANHSSDFSLLKRTQSTQTNRHLLWRSHQDLKISSKKSLTREQFWSNTLLYLFQISNFEFWAKLSQ